MDNGTAYHSSGGAFGGPWFASWHTVQKEFDDEAAVLKKLTSHEQISIGEGCAWITKKQPAA